MTKQGLDPVEGSTLSEMEEKETARMGGTGNTEAQASPSRVNEQRMNVRLWNQQPLDQGSARSEHSGRRGADGRKSKPKERRGY
jgi:hypothetical protein